MSSNQKKKPKKRGRKSKKEKEAMQLKLNRNQIMLLLKKAKKRAEAKRRKIIKAESLVTNTNEQQNPNIILHLKCQEQDSNKFDKCALLNDNSSLDTMDINNNSKLDFFELNKKEENISQNKKIEYNNEEDVNMKVVYEKIKKLKVNLRHNNVLYKRASCFWCTYEFDNPPIFIPRSKKGKQ